MEYSLTDMLEDSAVEKYCGAGVRELAEKAVSALERCEPAIWTWTRSHSTSTWRNITVGGQYSTSRRLRQVAAELQNKQQAMVEAYYTVRKRQAKAELFAEKAADAEKPAEKRYYELLADEQAKMAKVVTRPYIGAMRDVLELSKLHDVLVEQMREKHGRVDEEVFEHEEARYWIKRAFSQSLRDIRASGRITKGEQELLEQLGLDPMYVAKLLTEYLVGRDTALSDGSASCTNESLERQLEEWADEYGGCCIKRLERIGFPVELDTGALCMNNIAGSEDFVEGDIHAENL